MYNQEQLYIVWTYLSDEDKKTLESLVNKVTKTIIDDPVVKRPEILEELFEFQRSVEPDPSYDNDEPVIDDDNYVEYDDGYNELFRD